MVFGSILGLGLSAPAWLALFDYIHGSARQVDPASSHFQWLVPPAALPAFILPNWTVNWTNFSSRGAPHTSAELACGLVAPIALLAGLLTQPLSLVRRIKWELALLVLVLIISMLPSANLFRWSFRWLPLVHLLLALCAAESLQILELSPRRFLSRAANWALIIVALAIVAMLLTGTSGLYAWPFVTILFCLALFWAIIDSLPTGFRGLQRWMPAVITFAVLLATYLCLPTNCGVPKFNLSQELLSAAPLDPQRLYLSIYPPPDSAYGYPKDQQPMGRILRPGSTSMWAGLHFINGYSPVRTAGVARAFDSYVHGDIDPDMANYLLGSEAGRDGQLAKLGVDGIIVANEMQLVPKPETEWELVHSDPEGRVYHRRGGAFERIRSVPILDSRPNDQFATAAVSLIENSRNRVVADVNVPSDAHSALLTFSRPFFRGYRARIESEEFESQIPIAVLFPTVEIPAGTNGRLDPDLSPSGGWYAGGVFAAISALICASPLFLDRECFASLRMTVITLKPVIPA